MDSTSVQQLAHQACFATDYSIKSRAEESFFNLCQNLDPANMSELMNNYSQTVLFVIMEYVHKILPRVKDVKSIFTVLNFSVEKWFTNKATLVRFDQKALESYVENSVGRTMGLCMKFLYSVPEQREWVCNFIKQRPNSRYRLYLWKIFIETVSYIDSNFSFLTYRALVYSFQQAIIPEIMDELLPYFQSVEENIKVNELANMQANLAVSENGHSPRQTIELFNPGQYKFTSLVFSVLNEIICFNYNLTYTQFESQTPIDNCLVNFPDKVTKKVTNKQFVESMFFITHKLILENIESPFLTICFECIQKIMLTKLFYCPAEIKKSFIQTSIKGFILLFRTKGLNEVCLSYLIEANLKMLINIELYQIREFKPEFDDWILSLHKIIFEVIEQTSLNFDNDLLTECLELTAKIVEEAVSPQLKEELESFREFGFDIVFKFLQTLLSKGQSINGDNKITNYEALKKNSNAFFKRVRSLCSLNLGKTFNFLDFVFKKIMEKDNYNNIANAYFLMSQLCEQSIFDRNLLYQSPSPEFFPEFGKLVIWCLEWIGIYRSGGKPHELVDASTLFFVEKVLNECLNNFSYDKNRLILNSNLFKYIKMSSKNISEEEFLTYCFNQITANLNSWDQERVSYIFQVLGTLLLKFKWGLKRENFKQTAIAKNVLDLCERLSEENFFGSMLKLRKKMFKIITSISFDDILDDYRANITSQVQKLAITFTANRWKAMYDLAGICEAIDTATIYRYFLTSLNKVLPISEIMKDLFSHSNNDLEILKSIFKLQLNMIDNKGQRLSGVKNSFHNYKLIGCLMPYWAEVLSIADSEEWDEILLQIYLVLSTMLKGTHVNFFLLEKTVPTYQQYLKNLLQNMVKVSSWIEHYLSLYAEYRNNMQLIAKQLMEVIFCNPDSSLSETFDTLLGIFMEISLKQMALLREGNKKAEDILDGCLELIKNAFKYLRGARRMTHKEVQIKNIGNLNKNMEAKYRFIVGLFQFGISIGKSQPRFLDSICLIIYNMDFLAQASFPSIVQQLGLDEKRRFDLLNIWKVPQENQFEQDLENEQFVSRIKQWFKKCDAETLPDIEY